MSNTMAEAFCEEYLITWTEHGQDFTGWLHRDIFTRSNRMSQAGAISLFHQPEPKPKPPGIPRVSGRAPGATATQPTQQEKPASP